ncbi:MAG TPA: hypothetical protein ENI85_08005 [Deltaproteobacteria bacterium]|nr:hypothetical protein [Deltaproteobacteria bacterium]
MLEDLLKEHGGELVSSLTSGAGLAPDQAEKFLPPAVSGIGEALGSGGLDLSDLLGGGGGAVSALLEKIDIGPIAAAAGLDEERARKGLASLVSTVMSLLGNKAGGAEGLLSMLGGSGEAGGALGALGGMAGKLFGK